MKLLLSAYACDPTRGSEPGCGWNWVYHTAQFGNEVWCITRASNRKNIEEKLATHPVKNLHFVYVTAPWWIEYLNSKYDQFIVYPHYLIWQYQAYQVAKRLHQRESFDLVHHVSYGSLQLGSHLWKLNVPFVFGPIGGAQHMLPQFQHHLARGRWQERVRLLTSNVLLYYLKNTKKAIQNSYLVLATNQETYQLAQELGAARVALQMDNGIADDFFPKAFPVRQNRERMEVMWVGRMVANKGFSLVLDAFRRLPAQYPIYLTVIGDGPLEKYYRKQVERYGLKERVTFRGRLPFSEITTLYRNSDALIYTGLRNTFGIQLLEAMSFGLPIITLNLHGVRAFLPENIGIKVEPDTNDRTTESIKKAVMELYFDSDQRIAFGRNAYQYAQKHTWSNKIAEVNQAYPAPSAKSAD